MKLMFCKQLKSAYPQRQSKNSTVFRTDNRQLIIFGKTIDEISEKWQRFTNAYQSNGYHLFGQNGALTDLFKGGQNSELEPEVLSQFEQFKEKFNHSNLSADALAEEMGDVDSRIVNYARTCENGRLTTTGFTEAMNGMSLSAKAGKAALSAFTTAANMAVGFLIMAGIEAAATAIDNYVHRVENANQAMDEAVSAYDSAKSSLESINTELAMQEQQMNALLSKKSLTYIEKSQLEDLKEATNQLQIQEGIEEKRAERASKEAADKTVDAYKTQYGKYEVSRANINESMVYDNYLASESADENDIAGSITALLKNKKLLEEAKKTRDTAVTNNQNTAAIESDIQFYTDEIDAFSRFLDDNISDLEEKRLALQDEYDKAVETRDNGSEDLTTSEKNIIDTYDSISNSIKLIYEYTNPNKWNAMQIDKILNTEGIEKTKDELIRMAEAEELRPSKIAVSFPNLYNTIHDYGMTAQDLCNEIYACAEAADVLTLSFSEAWAALDTTEDSALKNELLSLAETGQLTVESFNNLDGSNSLLSLLGLGADDTDEIQDVIANINELASSSQQLASMKKGISGLSENLNAKRQNPSAAISSDVLAGMDSGLKAQTAEWDNYVSLLHQPATDNGRGKRRGTRAGIPYPSTVINVNTNAIITNAIKATIIFLIVWMSSYILSSFDMYIPFNLPCSSEPSL